MKVPDEMRKCAAFLEYQDNNGFHPKGTVFFVSMPSLNHPGLHFRYAITANHVITRIEEQTMDGGVYLRLNGPNSKVLSIRTEIDDWHFHPTDTTVDVAVLPVNWEASIDWLFFPVDSFITDEIITSQGIGVGDDIFGNRPPRSPRHGGYLVKSAMNPFFVHARYRAGFSIAS